jgi:hypothetical protein
LENIILERISHILADHYISVTHGARDIVIWGLKRGLEWSKEEEIIGKIAKLIENELYYKDIGEALCIPKYGIYSEKPDIRIVIVRDRGVFGNPYLPIRIAVDVSDQCADKFVNEIMKDLRLEKDERTLFMGRHRIRFTGYPFRFTGMAKLPLNFVHENEEFMFTINLDRYYISEGDLEINHGEHGITKYKIMKDIFVAFRNTTVHMNNDSRFNYYALKRL